MMASNRRLQSALACIIWTREIMVARSFQSTLVDIV